jgi:hypothetical protein
LEIKEECERFGLVGKYKYMFEDGTPRLCKMLTIGKRREWVGKAAPAKFKGILQITEIASALPSSPLLFGNKMGGWGMQCSEEGAKGPTKWVGHLALQQSRCSLPGSGFVKGKKDRAQRTTQRHHSQSISFYSAYSIHPPFSPNSNTRYSALPSP